jgi:glucose/mannose-6-phosphate isomerase
MNEVIPLITKLDLKEVDKKEMYLVYDKWSEIAEKTYEENWESLKYQNIDHIVFAGMGGSGSIGDIFSAILSQTKLHVTVVKGYTLPKTVDKNSLVVITSVSGNTVEALSILEQTKYLECNLIAASSGGKIEKICNKNNIEYRKIKEYNSPRASLVSFTYSMLKILKFIIPIKERDIIESIKNLKQLENQISSNNLTESNKALNLAKEISGIPLIYYPWGLQAAGIRFKNALQENAKMHALIEDVVEASHNGIVAWEKKSEVFPILLQGDDDNIKTKERWKVLKIYFDENNIEYKEIISIKGNILSKLIHLIYLLDYTSIYKAVISKIDPTPVKSIEFIKSRLEE